MESIQTSPCSPGKRPAPIIEVRDANKAVFESKVTKNLVIDTIPIVFINSQSVKNKKDDLERLILGYNRLPILCLCETWLAKGESNMLLPLSNCYSVFRSDRERGYGGVAIMIPKPIPALETGKSTQCNNFETVWVQLTFSHKPIFIGMIYRPPRPHCQSMPYALINHIKSCLKPEVPTIIGGDFNYSINWADNTSNNQNGQNHFLEFINDNGLSQLVTFPTRHQNLLDLVFTNEANLIQAVEAGPKISDHETVSAQLTIERIVSEKITYRDFKSANFAAVNNAFSLLLFLFFSPMTLTSYGMHLLPNLQKLCGKLYLRALAIIVLNTVIQIKSKTYVARRTNCIKSISGRFPLMTVINI